MKEAVIQQWFINCLCKCRHRQCTSEFHPSRTCSLQCSLQSSMSSKLSTMINAISTRIKSPKSPKARTWISLDGNDLLMEDKWLIESGKWINDQIICAWQFLLQQKYPSVGGLHSTVLVSKRNSREIRGSMKLCKFSTVETTTGLQYQHLGVMLVLCTGWTACTVDHHLS